MSTQQRSRVIVSGIALTTLVLSVGLPSRVLREVPLADTGLSSLSAATDLHEVKVVVEQSTPDPSSEDAFCLPEEGGSTEPPPPPPGNIRVIGVDVTLSGPQPPWPLSEIGWPTLVPGIFPNPIECPGRFFYHPAITVQLPDGSFDTIHFGSDGEGKLTKLCPTTRPRSEDGRPTIFLPATAGEYPLFSNSEGQSGDKPLGDYGAVPGPGENNCGTALLCHLRDLIGPEATRQLMEQVEQEMLNTLGPWHHPAWVVVRDPFANCSTTETSETFTTR